MWIGMDVTYIVAVIGSPLSPNCSGKRSTIHICVSIMRSMNERKNVFMCRPTNPERARAHKALFKPDGGEKSAIIHPGYRLYRTPSRFARPRPLCSTLYLFCLPASPLLSLTHTL